MDMFDVLPIGSYKDHYVPDSQGEQNFFGIPESHAQQIYLLQRSWSWAAEKHRLALSGV